MIAENFLQDYFYCFKIYAAPVKLANSQYICLIRTHKVIIPGCVYEDQHCCLKGHDPGIKPETVYNRRM